MGLFDFIKNLRPPGEAAPEEEWSHKKLASLAEKASSKKLQPFDRDEAIRGVLAIGTHEAAISLLKRFSVTVDPTITDQEEKQLVFEGIVSIGKGQRGKRVSDAGKDAKEISDEPLTKEERCSWSPSTSVTSTGIGPWSVSAKKRIPTSICSTPWNTSAGTR